MKSEADGRQKYLVYLGSGEHPPSCECKDWQKSHWPCKHFFAVFDSQEGIGWHSLPKSYQENPLFNLDPDVLTLNEATELPIEPTIPDQAPAPTTNEEIPSITPPPMSLSDHSRKRDLKIIGLSCREKLNQLKDLTYLCTETSSLLELEKSLTGLLSNTNKLVKNKHDGLLHLPPEVKPTRKQQNYAPLQLRKRRKQKMGNDKAMEEASRVLCEVNDQGEEDIQISSPCKKKCSSTGLVQEEKPMTNHGKNTETIDANKVVEITEDSPDPEYWINFKGKDADDTVIILYQSSKENILSSDEELSDSEIYAGLQLLKRQFPMIGGLRDPAVNGDLVTPEKYEFVQVINSGGHWVCLSSIGCSVGEIMLFDSGGSSTPNKRIIKHSARLLFCDRQDIVIHMPPVQRQYGVKDCGLFALAFSTSICYGEDPSTRTYEQDMLRQHYYQCLENLEMQPFPSSYITRHVMHTTQHTTQHRIKIYCDCRMPDDGKRYVECSDCGKWFHPTCVYIPKNAMRRSSLWSCNNCS